MLVVIRRIAAVLLSIVVLGALLAPSVALATAPEPDLCHCAAHDHCPASAGKHVCHMAASSFPDGGPVIGHCDPTALLVVPALPAATSPSSVTAPAPRLVTRMALDAARSLLDRSSPPDVPPPRA